MSRFPVLLFTLFPVALLAASPLNEFTEILELSLNKVTLGDIEKRLGKTTLKETGDAADYSARLCYFIPKKSITLIFSSGELGGSNHKLLGYMIQDGKNDSMDCRSIDIQKPISAGRLKLGLSNDEVAAFLGKPRYNYPDYDYYEHTRELESDGSTCGEITSVFVYYRSGKVWKYGASRAASC